MQKSIDELGAKSAALIRRMDTLVQRCIALVDDGDRSAYWLQASYTFVTGSNVPEQLALNNPLDAKFFGQRLNLYLQSRIIDETDPSNDELTFRPTDWCGVNDWLATTGLRLGEANCVFNMRSPRGSYANTPLSITNAFSTRHGVPTHMPVSAYLGGRDFHRPEVIQRGESLIVSVLPLFSRKLTTTEQVQFRVTAVLQGFKQVRAFR